MKYEAPNLTPLATAITAIQSKKDGSGHDSNGKEPPAIAYEDWEE